MAEQSRVSDQLFLLSGIDDFQSFAQDLLGRSRRTIRILSNELDPDIYGSLEFVDAISHFARSSRYALVQILVKDSKLVAGINHPLAKLHQRLPSKIELRKLTQDPSDTNMAFLLGDSDLLLFKNDDRLLAGFCNWEAAVEAKPLIDEFERLWQFGELEPDLQVLHI